MKHMPRSAGHLVGLGAAFGLVCPSLSAAPAQCASVQRVSLATSGVEGNASSLQTVVTPDGRWSAFASLATNLVSGDTNGLRDVFVHDSSTGITVRVSVSTSGAQGDGNSSSPQISDEGRFVSFESLATNLVTGDGNATQDVFVHDRMTGTTTLVSRSASGVQANGQCGLHTMSSSADYIAFWSTATNLVPGDTNGVGDVFVRERATGVVELVSVSSGGSQGNAESADPSISADGRLVAFGSIASNLVPGDTNGFGDCFLRDRLAGTTARISVSTVGLEGNGGSSEPRISDDGTAVVFWGTADNLVPGDTNGAWDVFVHDLSSDSTTRISVSSQGVESNGNSASGFLSATGRYACFYSFGSNLVPADDNGMSDVFLHDRTTGLTRLVTLGLGGLRATGTVSARMLPGPPVG